MNNLLCDYEEDLKDRKVSVNTIISYRRDVCTFLNFIDSKDIIASDVDKYVIIEYFKGIKEEGKADSTLIRNFSSINGFYKYLIKVFYLEKNPMMNIEMPKILREIPQILTVMEMDKLLSMPDENNIRGLRDRTMLELLYASGVKVTELLKLKLNDINIKLSYIRCKGTKNKERIVPIGSFAVKYLEKYLKERPTLNGNESKYVFINYNGANLTRQYLWKIVKYYTKIADIKKVVNCNTIRHSFAVHLLQNGADIRSVQELLGISDATAVQIYSIILKKNKLAEVYKNTHPRA